MALALERRPTCLRAGPPREAGLGEQPPQSPEERRGRGSGRQQEPAAGRRSVAAAAGLFGLAALLAALQPRAPAARAIMSVTARGREFEADREGSAVAQRQPARVRLTRARQDLQLIDDDYADLIAEDKGAAVRKRIKRVVNDLGPLNDLAIEIMEDPKREVDMDKLLPLTDNLGSQLSLATNWTIEADDCWNSSCNVQELDEARDSMLDAVYTLMKLERL